MCVVVCVCVYVCINMKKKYYIQIYFYLWIFQRQFFVILVWFSLIYGISTIMAYLMPNPLNTLGVFSWRKAMDCRIVVSEFELQSHYYVHFRTNTLWKVMNPLILPAMGYIVPLLFIYKDGFGIK